jgi:hypothetical protein
MSVGGEFRLGRWAPLYGLWLGASAILGYWFAWAAVSAFRNVQSDAGGNLVFASSAASTTVYPFTYFAAIGGFLALTLTVAVRGHRSNVLYLAAPIVAYVSIVGMINVYEQVFLAGLETTTHSVWWWTNDWGTLGSAGFSILGLSWSLAAFPWWRRANLVLAGPLVALFLGTMGIWILLGFPPVESGIPWVYALNAVSRVAATFIPVALTTPESWRERLFAALARVRPTARRRFRARADLPGSSTVSGDARAR